MLRIKNKKWVILYLYAGDKFFKIVFVFDQKAANAILKANVAAQMVNEDLPVSRKVVVFIVPIIFHLTATPAKSKSSGYKQIF